MYEKNHKKKGKSMKLVHSIATSANLLLNKNNDNNDIVLQQALPESKGETQQGAFG